jgi:hypothetical protein
MPTLLLTLRRVALAWVILLFGAALILPNLRIQVRSHPAVKIVIAAYWVLLLIGTPIPLVRHFRRAWREAPIAPNRTIYVIWLCLETACAAGLMAFLLCATVAAVLVALR